jgi:tetratricopeptide (TPR) repeat protein
LELLDLTGTKVTDAGLTHLEGLPKLQTVHVGGTEVTEKGADELARSFSGRVRIYRRDFSHLRSDPLNPKNASTHVNLGSALLNLGRTEEATEHFLKAIAHQPSRKEAYYGLGSALKSTGRKEEAAVQFRRALDIDPGYADAHLSLGLILFEAGTMDDARQHLAQAVRLAPRNPVANYWYGHLLHRQGDPADAALYYDRAVQLDPENAMALLGLAGIRIMADHPDLYAPKEAVALAEKACQLTANEWADGLHMLAQIYAAAGRLDDAVRTGTRALDVACADGNEDLVRRIQKNLSAYQRTGGEKPD